MSHIIRSTIVLILAVILLGQSAIQPVAAEKTPVGTEAMQQWGPESIWSVCTEDRPHDNSNAVYRICTPPWWWPSNGDLVIWAHGYVDVTRPVEIPEDQLCLTEDFCIPEIVNFLGYHFATTSYAVNGLAVVPGIQDVIELVDLYTAEFGPPGRVYLVGASEGGLITTLSVEGYPEVFDGGLALCGPIGDFRRQINYFGDFRVVLDYFYPGLVPGGPTNIPPGLLNVWDKYYPKRVYPEVFDPANRSELRQLTRVTRIPFDRANPRETLEESVEDVLWYNVFATNNASEMLGGQPFGNLNRIYRGSLDDDALNADVQRISADPAALAEIEANYQTTGELSNPLVTLHTTLDQQVPYWHERLYLRKAMASGAWPELYAEYPPTERYGHCLFDVADVLGAFGLLVQMVSGQGLDEDLVEELLSQIGPAGEGVPFHPYR
jgi:pimeloyl-ACP methyl ester carboxylesterase